MRAPPESPGAQRIDDRGVLALAGASVMLTHAGIGGPHFGHFGAHPPQLLDDVDHSLIARCRSDQQVEFLIRLGRRSVVAVVATHDFEQLVEPGEHFRSDGGRSKRRRLAFEQRARLGQFERADRRGRVGRRGLAVGDIDARSRLDDDPTDRLERDLRLPDRHAADPEPFGQLSLAGQTGAGGNTP
ncbi:hypothetical protein LRS08_10795 [Sphingomonas sp. J315]|nr:hypothetical protein [Sphingomonas sp. J315]UUX98108.1 hypothetical protein LRS08_10795 [Sphingomonas sp. J315]